MIRRIREALAHRLRQLAELVDWPYAEGCEWHPLVGGPEPLSWAQEVPCASVEETGWHEFVEWIDADSENPAGLPRRPYACTRPLGHPGPWHAASDGDTILAAWTGQVGLDG